MSFWRSVLVACLFIGSSAHAASKGGFGLHVGVGVPFLSQAGFDYQMSDKFGLSLGYNMLDLSVGDAKSKLSMPELLLRYHPFSGSFYLAAGVGQETLNVSATATGGAKAEIDVKATTTIVKTGWMWGAGDGGIWFGMDVSFISPSGAEQTITAPGVPTSDQAYIDALDAAKKFGETAYTNITFARLGYLF